MPRPKPEDFGLTKSAKRIRFDGFVKLATYVFVTLFFVTSGGMTWIYFETLVRATFLWAVAMGIIWCFFSFAIEEPRTAAYRKALKKYDVYSRDKRFWNSLSGRDFESELAELFRRAGYRADMTSASNDKGVDLVLTGYGERIIVQCKRHKKPVGPAIVRELYGAFKAEQEYGGAQRAILVCTSGVTSKAREFLEGRPIVVMDVDDIIEYQKQVASFETKRR